MYVADRLVSYIPIIIPGSMLCPITLSIWDSIIIVCMLTIMGSDSGIFKMDAVVSSSEGAVDKSGFRANTSQHDRIRGVVCRPLEHREHSRSHHTLFPSSC